MGALVPAYGAHHNPPALEPAIPASELKFLIEFIVFLIELVLGLQGPDRAPAGRDPPRARRAA